ncbi:MAG: RdgB/HAM1 family non-canonical purine NTP pyrophosphatase [Oscillospiraceae bacterium]|nr:RdgB/HAM1 family non-canonical purine NTP pyrophosphatase [Oscillospiraceae bacterium]
MDFAIATNNKKKLAEINRILNSLGHHGKSLKELGIDIEIVEDGNTFAENALIKAKTVAKMCSLITISDDSGLEVDYLNGAPGVYTARYAGENATDDENIDKLLDELRGVEKENRTARFVSAVCMYDPSNGENHVFIGTCEGYIGEERLGYDGFGYDPVFMVGDRSYAQMSPEEKDSISHRGTAMRKLERFLQGND